MLNRKLWIFMFGWFPGCISSSHCRAFRLRGGSQLIRFESPLNAKGYILLFFKGQPRQRGAFKFFTVFYLVQWRSKDSTSEAGNRTTLLRRAHSSFGSDRGEGRRRRGWKKRSPRGCRFRQCFQRFYLKIFFEIFSSMISKMKMWVKVALKG